MNGDKKTLPVVNARSAGGVVFRSSNVDNIEVALIKTAEEGRWQLPKGLIDPGEDAETAALREVREEAGLECEILKPLTKINYWFTANYDGETKKYHKEVSFYLMKFIRGDVNNHDNEVLEARWVNTDKALELLSFENEREVLKQAISEARKILQGNT
jgi:8-oxo-dGTP pyrophosphatase MutT (NUDIX family)